MVAVLPGHSSTVNSVDTRQWRVRRDPIGSGPVLCWANGRHQPVLSRLGGNGECTGHLSVVHKPPMEIHLRRQVRTCTCSSSHRTTLCGLQRRGRTVKCPAVNTRPRNPLLER
jgi:hypothetical protein